jgi:hypothetical protein
LSLLSCMIKYDAVQNQKIISMFCVIYRHEIYVVVVVVVVVVVGVVVVVVVVVVLHDNI